MQTKEERDLAAVAAAPSAPVASAVESAAAEDMVTLDDGTVLTFAERTTFGAMNQKTPRAKLKLCR